jgi:transposase
VPPVVDHDCALLPYVEEQQRQLEAMRALAEKQQRELDETKRMLEQVKKALIGPKSERAKAKKMLSPEKALGATSSTPEQAQARRRENAAEKRQLPSVTVDHPVPDDQRSCPKCGNESLEPLGDGRVTEVYEYVAKVVRVRHVQETLRCRCNGHVVTAPGAPKVVEQGHYGASFIAHLVVQKCVDHQPLYRLEKGFSRLGVPMKRSTMNELFHRAAHLTAPLSNRLLERIAARDVVQADETRIRVLDDGTGVAKNGFMWTFVAADDAGGVDIGYRFALDRRDTTPKDVLGGTRGFLLVDGYSGYNAVVDVDGRTRAACHAHLRRYFHEALTTEPRAQEAIDLILDLYRVEHEARDLGVIGTDSHLRLRQLKSAPTRDRLKAWLDDNLERHPPRSPIGIGIRYGLKQWESLGRFLEDVRVPLDNNASERALRRVALGRKNYLFVGDATAGANVAGLYALAATCEARGINPMDYFTDVLTRISDHPASRLDELLPGPWAAAQV